MSMMRSWTVCSHRPTIFFASGSSSFLSGGISTSSHLLLVISMAAMTTISTSERTGELEDRFGPVCITRALRDNFVIAQPVLRQELAFDLTPQRRLRWRVITIMRIRLILLTCVSILCHWELAASAYGDDWPQFRGISGQGICNEKDLPTTWSNKSGQNILWKAPLPKSDNPCSSPI